MNRGFRGVNGARHRESDEGQSATRPPASRVMKARYAGACAVTGARINVGDTICYSSATKKAVLVSSVAETGAYISDVIRTSGGTFHRNKRGRCEDAPCCGCCDI